MVTKFLSTIRNLLKKKKKKTEQVSSEEEKTIEFIAMPSVEKAELLIDISPVILSNIDKISADGHPEQYIVIIESTNEKYFVSFDVEDYFFTFYVIDELDDDEFLDLFNDKLEILK
jgi:hypothetical protein